MNDLPGRSFVLAAELRRALQLCRDESRRRTSLPPPRPEGLAGVTGTEISVRVSLDATELRRVLCALLPGTSLGVEQPSETKASAPFRQNSGRGLVDVEADSEEPWPGQDAFTSAKSASSKKSSRLHSGTFGGLTPGTGASLSDLVPTLGPEGLPAGTAKVPHVRGRPFGRVVYSTFTVSRVLVQIGRAHV